MENKALESALEKVKAQKVNFGFLERFDVDENWEVMKALEEIPRYRDLGTIDELAEMQVQYYHLLHQVKEFEKIGTIDELKALKEKYERIIEILRTHRLTDEMCIEKIVEIIET